MSLPQSVREAHEASVTGHSGSAPIDIILAIFPTIPASIAAAVIGQKYPQWSGFGLLMELILLVMPLALSFTHLANYGLELCTLMMAAAGIAVFFVPLQDTRRENMNKKYLGYLTSMRAHINLVTAIAIFAVDFRSFPRRFVKTEEFGYSLMDMGAAGFVIINGIVEGRKQPSYRVVLKDGIILTALGFLRLMMVKATDYQHHVTEYGVHANFFFTLAFLKLSCSWWLWRLKFAGCVLISIVFTIGHQAYLTLGDGAAWTFSNAPRDTLISANREWIVAMPGYMCIYFIGAAVGDKLFNSNPYRFEKIKWYVLLCYTVVSLGIFVILHLYISRPSRRIANPTFIYFCVFFMLTVLTSYAAIDDILARVFPRFSFIPVTFKAINQNSLLFFCLANVATGAMNKCVNTLDIVYPSDILIIISYTMGILIVMICLYSDRNKSKVL